MKNSIHYSETYPPATEEAPEVPTDALSKIVTLISGDFCSNWKAVDKPARPPPMIATRWGDSGSCEDDERTRELVLEILLIELAGKARRHGVRCSIKQHAVIVMCHKISKMMWSRIRQESVTINPSYLELTFIDQYHNFKSARNNGLHLLQHGQIVHNVS